MMRARTGKLLAAALVPIAIACAAGFAAEGIASLVGATLTEGTPAVAARLAPTPALSAPVRPTADAVLDRNPFDHATGSLRPKAAVAAASDLLGEIPPCQGVRPVVIVATGEPDASFAAFEVEGKRVLRRRNGEVAGMRVAYIGHDRVWLETPTGGYCRASLFSQSSQSSQGAKSADDAREAGARVIQQPGTPSAFEKEIAGKIVRRSETEFEIDRATVDRILEAQTELMKARVLPEKEGDKVIGVRVLAVKPGSTLALIGIQSNDRLETINGFSIGTPEEALLAYSRLRAGADHLVVHLTRNGRPMNIDYSIR
ncbi:MAG: general secretion pathway protein GspC [Deltaproteobacteria bacterium]|nr:general secretion pathway protein GspC [Deltaproteobacteria bacterium]